MLWGVRKGDSFCMTVVYGIIEETYALGEKSRVSYGIAAYANADVDGTITIVESIRDISSNKQKLLELVERCNRLGLSITHLHNVIDDFMAE